MAQKLKLTRRLRFEPNVRLREPGVRCGVRPVVFGVDAAVVAEDDDDDMFRLGVSVDDGTTCGEPGAESVALFFSSSLSLSSRFFGFHSGLDGS